MSDLNATRFPGYDVMAKRDTQSFNDATRQALAQRLAVMDEPQFFTAAEFAIVQAVAARLVPQPDNRPPIPVAGLVDQKLHKDQGDGYRTVGMPSLREAWRRGLAALESESQKAYQRRFCALDGLTQDLLLRRMQQGELKNAVWGDMPAKQFFKERLSNDIVVAYYSHPTSWSEMGFGGPAGPRGYVRMGFNERDPWEAVEVVGDDRETARKDNLRVGR